MTKTTQAGEDLQSYSTWPSWTSSAALQHVALHHIDQEGETLQEHTQGAPSYPSMTQDHISSFLSTQTTPRTLKCSSYT
jgi:hypothetical protein